MTQVATTYSPVDNVRRHRLIYLIYIKQMSIRQAAYETKISYPTAKAINRIYKKENRIEKKKVRKRKYV